MLNLLKNARPNSPERYQSVYKQLGRVIVGHSDIVHGVLTCLFVGGHCLLEGVPGLGKTLLVRTLAETLNLDFSRIQFTPDLMPADILGTNMIVEDQAGQREFQFQKGPIFTQICLADEINRATPKTQSALLEAMQERSISIAGKVNKLKEPFFVMATQNPIEQEGTYPLPEAQLDRFFFKLVVGYSSREELNTIIERTTKGMIVQPDKVMDGTEIVQWQQLVREVILAPARAGLHRPADAGDASRWAVCRADHESIFALGQQPARGANAYAGGQSAGAVERAVQRELRRRAASVSAGDAASRDSQFRGRGGGD